MSIPALSVPKRCARPGGWSWSTRLTARGSCVARIGAMSATAIRPAIIRAPARDIGLRPSRRHTSRTEPPDRARSAGTLRSATGAAMAVTGSPSLAEARIESQVEDVGGEVRESEHARADDGERHDAREVEGENGLHAVPAEARPVEDDFRDHGARQEPGE